VPVRRALASKDIGTTGSAPTAKGTGDGDKPNVFSKVFTPVTKGEIKQPTDYSLEPESNFAQAQNEAPKPGAQQLSLLSDVQAPFKVFSRPPEKDAVFSRPDSSVEDASNIPLPPVLRNRTPLGTFVPRRSKEVCPKDEDEEEQDTPLNDAVDYGEDIEDLEVAHNAPFGGRFGQFDVMTPITERTLEYTSTGRFSVPDGDLSTLVEMRERAFRQPDAVEAAERLAAEVREDNDLFDQEGAADYRHIRNLRDDEESSSSFEEPSFSRPPPFRLSEGHTILNLDKAKEASELHAVEEKTGSLNLSNEVFSAAALNPPNPCNPFDSPIVSTLLSLLPADPECHQVPLESQLLDDLQKFARKQMRTSGASNRSSGHSQTYSLHLGDTHFEVYEKLGEGGFGAVFAAKTVKAKAKVDADTDGDNDEDEDEDYEDEDEESHRVAIKVVKPSNVWEFRMLRKVHAELPARLRASIIHPQALYAFQDESFLILNLGTQGSLLDIINRSGQAGISQQGACLDELLVIFFTVELLRLLEGLHESAALIHGDLKIDNCLVRLQDVPGGSSAWAAQYDPTGAGGWSSKGIVLIDFGRAIDTRAFPRGQAFVAEWATDARDCVEMREGRPWTYQADYFGLAGIVYCMLYGKYIEGSSVVRVTPQHQSSGPRYKLATAFKRYWQADLWTRLFDVLLNPCLVHPDGSLPVTDTLAQLRLEMETWLQANCNRSSNTLKGLLKKIELSVIRGD